MIVSKVAQRASETLGLPLETAWEMGDVADWPRANLDDYRRRRMNRAHEMRLAPTAGEAAMERILAESEWWWECQAPIGNWIVDFYCRRLRLIVEVDGGYHYQPDQKAWDRNRDHKLAVAGFIVLRFPNEMLEHEAGQAKVAAEIVRLCRLLRDVA